MGTKSQPQLTISTLCHELVRIQHEHGDLPMVLNDADTGWTFLLKAGHLDIEKVDNAHGKRLAIEANYGDERDA